MFTIKKTVGYSDLFIDGLVSVSAIVDFLQDCGSFHMSSLDLLTEHFNNYGVRLFLAFMQTDIKKYSRYGEELEINTWAYEMNSRYGFRNYTVYDKSGDLCACAYAVGVFVDIATGKPAKLSDEVLHSHPLGKKFEMEYTPRKISVLTENGHSQEKIKVCKYHLDENNHVNNARYIDMAYEFLPEDFKPKRIRVEYKSPAKLGTFITPVIYDKPSGNTINLCDETGKPYAIIDFE